MYGATAIKMNSNTLVTIDPYTARVTTIGRLVNQSNPGVGVTVPDLTFAGTHLLGWDFSGPALIKIDTTTGMFSSFAAAAGASPGAALASITDGGAFVVQGHNLSRVNTADGSLVRGPMLVNDAGANGLTFVGGVIYASEPTSVTPKLSTLVTINQTTGAVTAVGPLPPNADAIVGIQSQSISTSAVSPAVDTASPPPVQAGTAPRHPEMLRIAGHPRLVRDVLALGRDIVDGARVRRFTPLAALARLGLGGQVVLVSQGGEMRMVALNASGLGLTENHRHQLKLVDTREGFQQIFAPIAEIRRSDQR